MPATGDYREIRSLVVHTEDVVAAVEANRTGSSRAVLRVTPPFSARMRARLHVERAGEYAKLGGPEPIHVDPSRLLADAPAPPTPDETEEALRGDPHVEYTVETHHERHMAAMTRWRESLVEALCESVELDGQHGPHRVSVAVLG